MPEKEKDNENYRAAGRKNKRVWLALIIVVLAAIIAYLVWSAWNSKSAEQQLAEIEAAHAIPDTNNAAVVYAELLQDPNAISATPDFLDGRTDWIVKTHPWTSEDYPNLAEWLKGHEGTIAKLMEASKFDKCFFEIGNYGQDQITARVDRLQTMGEWACLLLRAANNDTAEGRTNAAIDKYRCLMQLGRHICQQPVLMEYLYGIPFEGMALGGLQRLIIQMDLTENQLKIIQEFPLSTRDDWAGDSAEMFEIERLWNKQSLSPLERLKEVWDGTSIAVLYEKTEEIYLLSIAKRRAFKIITALRRYKNTQGRWPESLDEIKSLAPPELFVDPISGDSFVYKLVDDTFTLYSKGKNKIDENSQWDVTVDPNTYKSIEELGDDRLFWP